MPGIGPETVRDPAFFDFATFPPLSERTLLRISDVLDEHAREKSEDCSKISKNWQDSPLHRGVAVREQSDPRGVLASRKEKRDGE